MGGCFHNLRGGVVLRHRPLQTTYALGCLRRAAWRTCHLQRLLNGLGRPFGPSCGCHEKKRGRPFLEVPRIGAGPPLLGAFAIQYIGVGCIGGELSWKLAGFLRTSPLGIPTAEIGKSFKNATPPPGIPTAEIGQIFQKCYFTPRDSYCRNQKIL